MPASHCSRRQFLSTLGATGLAFASAGALAAPEKRPNIIFILTDDQGWGDSGHFGHPYMKTPSLDRIAREGTWFRQFYVNNPVCSPSRTAFMTGLFPARKYVHQHFATAQQNAQRGMPNWLDAAVPTVWDLMKGAGYATAHFGKWHLCGGNIAEAPLPAEYGIDDNRVVNGPGPTWDQAKNPYFRAQSTGLIVDEAIRFIRANRERPFFASLWTLVPHASLNPTPEELAVYENLQVNPDDFKGYMRDYVAAAKNMTAQMKVFCAAMTGLDSAIGRLLDFLDAEGLAQDTIIFYSSDNGPEDYHIGNASNAGIGYPGILRARKRSLYEGGVRTPLMVRWPGRVKAGRAEDDAVLTAVDFLPTVCKLVGVAPGDIALDGEDVSDILLGASRPRTKPIFWEWRSKVAGNPAYFPPPLAIRDGEWKLLMKPDGTGEELYHIPKDPGERDNVAAGNPDVVARLKPQLLAWKQTIPGDYPGTKSVL